MHCNLVQGCMCNLEVIFGKIRKVAKTASATLQKELLQPCATLSATSRNLIGNLNIHNLIRNLCGNSGNLITCEPKWIVLTLHWCACVLCYNERNAIALSCLRQISMNGLELICCHCLLMLIHTYDQINYKWTVYKQKTPLIMHSSRSPTCRTLSLSWLYFLLPIISYINLNKK